jgi:hypothetical protein
VDAAKERRLRLLRARGAFGDVPGLVIRRVFSDDDLAAARAILDAGYHRAHYDADTPWIDGFWGRAATHTFLALLDGAPVGTDSMVLDSPAGLPCERAFHEEVWHLRLRGQTPLEGAFLAVAPVPASLGILTAIILRLVGEAANTGRDAGLTVVSVSHAPMYEALGFARLAGPRRYSDAPADRDLEYLMALDLHHAGPTLALLRGER